MLKYREFCDKAREAAPPLPESGQIAIHITVKVPASLSKKKQHALIGTPHKSRPDLDNYIKGVCDALWPSEDSAIWSIQATKHWGSQDQTLVRIVQGSTAA